jgi:hypothetical protein
MAALAPFGHAITLGAEITADGIRMTPIRLT